MPDNSLLSLEVAYHLLTKDNPGLKPILLPIGPNSKGPYLKAWQKTTYERTQEPWYKSYFVKKFNSNTFEEIPGYGIGVLLGKSGNGICTIDCDSDDVASAFESLNPWTPTTLQTRGARGRNFWVRIDGDIPPTRKFLHKSLGAGGEWRADGGQTVLSHIHKDTLEPYQRLNDCHLEHIKFEEIKWPEELEWGDAGIQGRAAELKEVGSYVESQGGIYALRQKVTARHLTVVRWVNSTKAICLCPGKKGHTNDNKDETDCWVMTDGMPKIHCMHQSCSSARKITEHKLREDLFFETAVVLPNLRLGPSESATQLYKLLASTGRAYRQGREPTYIIDGQLMNPNSFQVYNIWSRMGIVFAKYQQNKGGSWEMTPVVPLSEQDIKRFSDPEAITDELSPIRSVSNSPLLTRDEHGELIQYSTGYSKEARVWINSNSPTTKTIPLEEALASLSELLDNFKFKEPKDKANALAAVITPALYMGGFVGEHIPAWLVMADKPAAGKTFIQKIVSWIYNFNLPQSSSDSNKFTVGGMEEQIKRALLRGDPFVQVDNIRGKIDSQFLESLITGEKMFARLAYSAGGEIERPRGMIMFTGNEGFHVTRDMATRVFLTRLTHQPESNWRFRGELLEDYVRKHWRYYLECVFSIVREWWARGMPKHEGTKSRFVHWGESIDAVMEGIWGTGCITQDLGDMQLELHDPIVTWASQLMEHAIEDDLCDLHAYRAGHLVHFTYDFELEFPGLLESRGPTNSQERARVESAIIARGIKRLAADRTTIPIGNGFIHIKEFREIREDKRGYRNRSVYILSQNPEPPEHYEVAVEV